MGKTKILKVNPAIPEPERIAEAAHIIRQGGLVIFPTETVYGIAADANNPKAMERLMMVKHRRSDKRFSILIPQRSIMDNYSHYDKPDLFKVIDKYWPGPLTIIVPSKENGETIGIRMPDHTIALRLVEESGCTVAAPSANLEGKKAPVSVEEALEDLDGLIDLAIDGGPVDFGISSTIVDFTKDKPTVIREGVISQPDIDRTVNKKVVLFVCTGNSCRSVMAEYLLKAKLRGRDDVDVQSAGTSVMTFNTPASFETISVLRQRGIDATGHQSHPLSRTVLRKADLIIAMTRSHRMQILDRVPFVEKRVYLLKEFAPHSIAADLDVSDPIGQSHAAYEECLLTINEAIEKIVELFTKIFTGADHRGFELKKTVNEYLKSKGHDVIDCGVHVAGTECDYPQISYDVATQVVGCEGSRGILLCMTGIGHSICANKIPGALAALVYNTEAAALSRQHNNSNILVLGSKFVDEKAMLAIIDIWLTTAFEGGRHQRRVDAIHAIEQKFLK